MPGDHQPTSTCSPGLEVLLVPRGFVTSSFRTHRANAAAAESQKVLDHRSIVLNSPLGPLASLNLARAYSLQGNIVKARAQYGDFLSLWKDADPDSPILKEAKAEYAGLQ
jgi:hypothetical protein